MSSFGGSHGRDGTGIVDITSNPSSPSRDAFGRLRVSTPTTVFESKQLSDHEALRWNTTGSIGTSATYAQHRASTTLTVPALTASWHIRQSRHRPSYQPGKTHTLDATWVMGPPQPGIIKRVGMFDESNGLFFSVSGSSVGFVNRSSTSGVVNDEFMSQSVWNVDKFDGRGPSGLTLDLSKVQIGHIDAQFLFAGDVRFGFNIDGELRYAHIDKHANIINSVYTANPNMPVCFEIRNDGTGLSSSLETICCSVLSEGGRELAGIDRAIDRDMVPLVVPGAGNWYPLVAARIDPTTPWCDIKPVAIDIGVDGQTFYCWRLLMNPTFIGTQPTWSAITGSHVQGWVPTAATTVTNGLLLGAGSGRMTNTGADSATSITSPDLRMGCGLSGSNESDIVCLAVRVANGNSLNFYGGILYHEGD